MYNRPGFIDRPDGILLQIVRATTRLPYKRARCVGARIDKANTVEL